ncbi:MAG: hypothetical protein N2Z79_02225 [Candidatus Omnitrophica bacterium]|nr:hypothetical protein [Candidatus Omnitrophota bacterium]
MKIKFGFLDLTKIYSFISGLSKRERFIFYTASILILLVIVDRLVIIPFYSKMSQVAGEIKDKEAEIRKAIHILSQKERINQQLKQYASFLRFVSSEEEQFTLVLKEIETLANKSNVYLLDLKPAGVKDKGLIKEYLINLNLEAKIESLVTFIYEVENSSLLLAVKKYQISPKTSQTSIVSCSMVISKTVVP